MKKLVTSALFIFFAVQYAQAQSRVFKEVGEGMSSTMEAIIQNDQLVGYIYFTQLEKASKDSFNYRIMIMDENLNDIGIVKFRDEQLQLQAVAFEQDVLCLAYLKSNIIGTEFKNKRTYKRSLDEAKNAVITQFITLEGKVINTNSKKVSIELRKDAFQPQYYGNYQVVFTKIVGYGSLEHPIQLANLPQKGFVCFYGDESKNHLLEYGIDGKESWEKIVPESANSFTLHTSGENIYLLAKRGEKEQAGGFEMLNFNSKGTEYKKIVLKDKQGNSLRALSLANDPVTGKPSLFGYIINPNMSNNVYSAKKIAKGAYIGVFSMNINNPAKAEVEEVYSYWNDGSKMPIISKKGYNYSSKTYPLFAGGFKDNEGNTHFTGSSFDKKTRWGNITASIILAPLVFVSPYLLYGLGTQKSTLKETVLMQQDANGKLTVEKTIPGNKIMYYPSKVPVGLYNTRRFYHITNSNTMSHYIVINDTKDVTIYNVEQKKITRTIPRHKGSMYYSVRPAKEGHMMVSQYDEKAKIARYSIEAL